MEARFFPTPNDFRDWLEAHHKSETELLVAYYKKASGIPSITWPESVDQALCFGWIDGIRKSIDDKSYSIRFTPRKLKSTWSTVNIKRVPELREMGLMQPAGLAAFERRIEKKSEIYAYEQKNVSLIPEYEQQIKANPKAWEHYSSLTAYVKKTSIWWVMSAKREETRLRRLQVFIESCEAGLKIPSMRR